MIVENVKTKKPKSTPKKTPGEAAPVVEASFTPVEELVLTPPVVSEPQVEASIPQQHDASSQKPKSRNQNRRGKRGHSSKKQAPVSAAQDVDAEELESQGQVDLGNELRVNLSKSLFRKICQQAEDEGISLEEFATELLAEGVVLRAFEIAERKNQMRGPSQQSSMGNNRSGNQQGRGNNNNNHNHRKGRGGMSHMRYQSIMEDKATFLEYVRNQERNRR